MDLLIAKQNSNYQMFSGINAHIMPRKFEIKNEIRRNVLEENQKEHILIQRIFVLLASIVSTILDYLRVIDGNFLISYYSYYF